MLATRTASFHIQVGFDGDTTATVERWNVRRGEKVKKGDIICIVKRDNQRSIRSEQEGYIEQICVKEGALIGPG